MFLEDWHWLKLAYWLELVLLWRSFYLKDSSASSSNLGICKYLSWESFSAEFLAIINYFFLWCSALACILSNWFLWLNLKLKRALVCTLSSLLEVFSRPPCWHAFLVSVFCSCCQRSFIFLCLYSFVSLFWSAVAWVLCYLSMFYLIRLIKSPYLWR